MQKYQCAIIGAGPAGYVAAIRAGQLGLKTVIIEKEAMGGMCLNWGCIPSKSMIESSRLFEKLKKASSFGIDGIDPKALSFNWQKAIRRKDGIVSKLVKGVSFLMKKNGIEQLSGEACITGPRTVTVGDLEIQADHILIATGSRPTTEPFRELSEALVLDMKSFFALKELPQKFLVYGDGIVAAETLLLLKSIGCSVELVLPGDSILPELDGSLSAYLAKRLKRLKIPIHRSVSQLQYRDGKVLAGKSEIDCDKVLNCARRTPVLPEFKGAQPKLKGRALAVDEFCQTTLPGVYAAGDVAGHRLAQIAMTMGICSVEHMGGEGQPVNLNHIPLNIYTDPEIASVGLSEEALQAKGVEYRKGEFPLSANGRALAGGAAEGFIKVLAEEPYGEIVGVHIVAPNATDQIAQAVSMLNLETTLEEVARMVHAHPSMSEVLWEAHLDALGRPLHK